MTRLLTAPAWLLTVGAATAFLASVGPARQPDPPPPADLRPANLDRGPKLRDVVDFEGRLVALDATSVTIQGWTGSIQNGEALTDVERYNDFLNHQITHRGPALVLFLTDREIPCRQSVYTRNAITVTDRDGEVRVIRRADVPHRRFPLSKSLAHGGTGDSRRFESCTAYRTADLRVGDEVDIDLEWEVDRKVCARILIERRPGGRVPPATHEHVSETWPRHHELRNVQQDWEAGIPIPEAYRKYYAHVLPAPTPVAPEPRPLPPRIPVATP